MCGPDDHHAVADGRPESIAREEKDGPESIAWAAHVPYGGNVATTDGARTNIQITTGPARVAALAFDDGPLGSDARAGNDERLPCHRRRRVVAAGAGRVGFEPTRRSRVLRFSKTPEACCANLHVSESRCCVWSSRVSRSVCAVGRRRRSQCGRRHRFGLSGSDDRVPGHHWCSLRSTEQRVRQGEIQVHRGAGHFRARTEKPCGELSHRGRAPHRRSPRRASVQRQSRLRNCRRGGSESAKGPAPPREAPTRPRQGLRPRRVTSVAREGRSGTRFPTHVDSV